MSLSYEAVVKLHNQVSGPARAAASSIRGMAQSIRQSQQVIAAGFDHSVERLKSMAALAGKAGVVLGGGVAAAGMDATHTASQFEDMGVSLDVLTGSAKKAQDAMHWIRDFNLKTPNELADVTSGFVQLKNQGIDPTDGTLKTLVDTAAAFSDKTLNDAVQMMTDAVMGEGERLKEFGIKQRQIAGKQGSSSGPKSLSMVSGARSSGATQDMVEYLYQDRNGIQRSIKVAKDNQELIRKTLLKIFDEKFAGLGEKRSQTLSGMLSNVKDMIVELQQQFIKGNADSTNSAGGLYKIIRDSTQAKLDWLTAMGKSGKFAEWGKKAADIYLYLNHQVVTVTRALKPLAQEVLKVVGGWKQIGLLAASGAGLWALSPLLSAVVAQLTPLRIGLLASVLAWQRWDVMLPKIRAHFPVLASSLGGLQQQLGVLGQQGGSALSQLWHWLMQNKSGWGQALGAGITRLLGLANHYFSVLNQKIASGNLGQWLDVIWQKAKPAVTAITEFGTGIWKSITAVAGAVLWVKELVGGWENLGKVVVALGLISYFSGLIQGVGALLGIIGSLVSGIGMIVKAGAFIGATASAVVVGIAAIAAAGYYLYTNWDKIAAAYRRMKPQLAETWWGRVIINTVTLVRKQLDFFRGALAWLGEKWEQLKVSWRDDAWGKVLRTALDKTLHPVRSFYELIAWLKVKWAETKSALQETTWGKVLVFAIEKLFSPLETLKTLWENAKALWEKLTGLFSDVNWSNILTGAIDKIREGIDALIQGWEKVKSITGEAWDSTKSAAKGVGESTKSYANAAVDATSNAISNTYQAVTNLFSSSKNKSVTERWDSIKNELVSAAKTAHVDPGTLAAIAHFESKFRADAKSPYSTAHGLGQFLNGTWTDYINKYGFKYGIAGAGRLNNGQAAQYRNDLHIQAAMLAELSKENVEIGKRLGGKDEIANVYALHNLGGGDGAKFLNALRNNPSMKVGALLSSRVIKGNPSLYAGGDISVAESYMRMGNLMRQGQIYAEEARQMAGMSQKEQSAKSNIVPIMSTSGTLQRFMGEVRGQHELTVNLKAAPGVNYSVVEKKTTGNASKFNLGKQAGAAL